MNTFKIIGTTLLLLVLGACTKQFEEINTNPNVPEKVDAQFLLTNILWNAANNNAIDAWNAGNFLAQLTARFAFNEIDRYDIRTNTELWNKTYQLLNDVKSLEELAESGNSTYKGIALVMRAFLTSTLTDLWVDVPYSDALKGLSEGNFTPSYDTQEEIYNGPNGILASLREAVVVLDASRNNLPIAGDIIYNGNVDQWIRFANSLLVRYLLRVSNRLQVGSELQSLVSSGMLMQGNEDNGLVPYLTTAPSQWFVHTIREGDYANVRMSTTIDSILTTYNDPRVSVWFKQTVASQGSTAVYEGIPNGLGPDKRSNYNLAQVSTLGAIFRDQPAGVNAVFMLYSELQFALAEAAEKGLISGNAQTYYEAGIQASFQYYNITMPTGYLSDPNIAWATGNNLSRIITQKWLASMLVGYEGWFNYRRTGFPALTPAVDNVNNNLIPVRYRYPDTEKAVNPNSYSEAVGRIGGDTYDAKGWWEQP